jgi:TPP-dependent pyruvate/acetoin dehydrogenase alpha subunit
MRRYPAFDPPEYLDWTPDPDIVEGYRERLHCRPERRGIVESLAREEVLALYRDLLRTRLHDIGLKRWVKTGVISKAWLGTGEEAVTVGSVAALDRTRDLVSPMIRNAGALHMMGVPLVDMFRGYLATADSPSRGRDLHVGDLARGVLQPISHMGINVPLLAGAALAFRLREEERVALTWIGDGATRTAAFHEGMNLAAVERLPVVFVLQNNQIALGTPSERHGSGDPVRWADAYGMECWEADGNHVLDVFAAATLAARRCRAGDGPALLVAETFRMGGHATHDEREAREAFPESTFQFWGRRDPIGLFEAYLLETGVPAEDLGTVEATVTLEMDAAADQAVASKGHDPPPESARFDGFTTGGVLEGLNNRPI